MFVQGIHRRGPGTALLNLSDLRCAVLTCSSTAAYWDFAWDLAWRLDLEVADAPDCQELINLLGGCVFDLWDFVLLYPYTEEEEKSSALAHAAKLTSHDGCWLWIWKKQNQRSRPDALLLWFDALKVHLALFKYLLNYSNIMLSLHICLLSRLLHCAKHSCHSGADSGRS